MIDAEDARAAGGPPGESHDAILTWMPVDPLRIARASTCNRVDPVERCFGYSSRGNTTCATLITAGSASSMIHDTQSEVLLVFAAYLCIS